MSDYWYNNRDRLNPGHVCILEDGLTVRLDRRVPGDGTDWYCDVWVNGSWICENHKIHPSDINKGPAW